jgi:hypothetical protein
VAKLRWLLAKAIRVFGHRRVSQLRPAEIAAWRMTIASGHRFEATQALRQVLARAVSWGLIDVNPAKQGVDNPVGFANSIRLQIRQILGRNRVCAVRTTPVSEVSRGESTSTSNEPALGVVRPAHPTA